MLNKMKADVDELIELLANNGAKGPEAKLLILKAIKNAKNNGTKLAEELRELSANEAHPTSFKYNLSLALANIDEKTINSFMSF